MKKKKVTMAFKSKALTGKNVHKIKGGNKGDLIIDDLSGIVVEDVVLL